MAVIAPFRGLRYNPERVQDFDRVVIPPYDVISPAEQETFHGLSPHNMIRLELGMTQPGDTGRNNAHTRAAEYLAQWRHEGVLVQDPEPAVYYYELDYSLPTGMETRYGFMALLRLEDFDSGAVKPHERTFKTVKAERLSLMLATHANLSPVFAVYSDPEGVVNQSLQNGRRDEPAMSFSDRNGMTHRVWKVANLEAIRRVRGLMADKPLFIADGHHRYETALNYRNLMRERYPQAGPRAAFEYIMVYLSHLEQKGLTILPTHRLLRNLDSIDLQAFLQRAEEFFHVSSFALTESGKADWLSSLRNGVGRKQTAIGFFGKHASDYYLFKVKPEPVSAFLSRQGIPMVLQDLDVAVLDQLVLRKLMGLSESYLSDKSNVYFSHDFAEAIQETRSCTCDAAFLINPTRIDQVQRVATAGEVMPHKSTYFYPKVGSGIAIHLLDPAEEILW